MPRVRRRRGWHMPDHQVVLGAILLYVMLIHEVQAKEFNILSLVWMTSGGQVIQNPDLVMAYVVYPIAMKHFNERYGGIVPAIANIPSSCNSTLRLNIYDASAMANRAMIKLLEKFNTGKLDAVHGPVRSDVAQTVAVTAGALRIPMISFSATAAELSNKQAYPTFYRTTTSDAQIAQTIAELFKSFSYSKVGMIHVNDGYGVSLRNEIVTRAEALGTRVRAIAHDVSATGPVLAAQLRSAMQLLVAERINVIFFTSLTSEVDWTMARVTHDLNWVKGKLYIGLRNFVGDSLKGAPEPDLMRDFLNGNLNIARGYDKTNPAWLNLQREWPTYNVSDVNPYLDQGNKSSKLLYQLPDDYFSTAADLTQQRYYALAFAYDSIVTLGLATCGSNVSLLENLKHVNFVGVTGEMKFDSSLDRRQDIIFVSLQNIRIGGGANNTDLTIVEVGRFANGTSWIISKPIFFSDGTTTPPMDVVVPTTQVDEVPPSAQAFGWTLVSIGLALGIIVAYFLLVQRADSIVTESQPILLWLLLIGNLLVTCSIIPLTIETSSACMGFPWLFGIGFTLALTTLVAKSCRLAMRWRAMERQQKRSQGAITVGLDDSGAARTRTLVAGIGLALVLMFGFLLSWQLVAPLILSMHTIQWDEDDNPLESSFVCSNSSTNTTPFYVLFVAFICLLVVCTMALGVWVRNAPDKYGEAKMTAVAGMSTFQIFFIAIPVAAVVWKSALPRFLALCAMTFVLAMVILFTMFFPKMCKLRYAARKNNCSERASNNRNSNENNYFPLVNTPESLTGSATRVQPARKTSAYVSRRSSRQSFAPRQLSNQSMPVTRNLTETRSSEKSSDSGGAETTASSFRTILPSTRSLAADLNQMPTVPRPLPQFLSDHPMSTHGGNGSAALTDGVMTPIDDINNMLLNQARPLSVFSGYYFGGSTAPPADDVKKTPSLNSAQLALVKSICSSSSSGGGEITPPPAPSFEQGKATLGLT